MIKILYLFETNDSRIPTDYLGDSIFHGLYNNPEVEIIDGFRLDFMYDDIQKSRTDTIHGKGFTLYGLLKDKNNRFDFIEKLNNKYFDFIIYGAWYRGLPYFDLVKKIYNKNQIIVLDGWDLTNINEELSETTIYFKRELIGDHKSILPISFSFPEEKIFKGNQLKTKQLALTRPKLNQITPYTFETEESYYNDYRCSTFAYTCKKGGWDCMRHYEIIANNCLPLFEDIKDCPKDTLFKFPKDILEDILNKFNNNLEINFELYTKAILDNFKNHLTTIKMANYLLEKICY